MLGFPRALAWLGVLCAVCVVGLGCAEERSERKSATCQSDANCAIGFCYREVCLEPEADDDLDGLTNLTEVELHTDPLNADSDEDGTLDGVEVSDRGSPRDTDGDGALDALECNICDDDCDGLANHEDPDDASEAPNLVLSGTGDSYQNWTLEEGGWGTSLGCDDGVMPHNGDFFLVVGHLCTSDAQSLEAAQIDQRIVLPSGGIGSGDDHRLTIRAWAGAGTPDSTAMIEVTLLDESDEQLGDVLRLETSSSPWVPLEWQGELPLAATSIKLSLRAERAGLGALGVAFDDVTLVALRCAGGASSASPAAATPGDAFGASSDDAED